MDGQQEGKPIVIRRMSVQTAAGEACGETASEPGRTGLRRRESVLGNDPDPGLPMNSRAYATS
jgi:hypothetical protein